MARSAVTDRPANAKSASWTTRQDSESLRAFSSLAKHTVYKFTMNFRFTICQLASSLTEEVSGPLYTRFAATGCQKCTRIENDNHNKHPQETNPDKNTYINHSEEPSCDELFSGCSNFYYFTAATDHMFLHYGIVLLCQITNLFYCWNGARFYLSGYGSFRQCLLDDDHDHDHEVRKNMTHENDYKN